MYSIRTAFLILVFLAGCGTDLSPSGTDMRPPVVCGTPGPRPCQSAPDFTISDSLGGTVTLSATISSPSTSAVVLYFTMWCTVCDTDMSLMRDWVIPGNPRVVFYAVDYVSASVNEARNAEIASGFSGSGFLVLADTSRAVLGQYQGTMATTVVIDRAGVVRMNESFKLDKLQSVLAGLP